MSRLLLPFFFVVGLLVCSSPVAAVCTPGTNWTETWTDNLGQTTYTLEAPCKVYIGIPFDIIAKVTDTTYQSGFVAHSWALKDNGATFLGGGFNFLSLTAGSWQQTYSQTYTGVPIDHTLQFVFTDMGAGSGAHNYSGQTIGALTVDPWLIDAGPDRTVITTAQGSTVLMGTAPVIAGSPLNYRWLEGTTVLQDYQAVNANGQAPLTLATVPALSLGLHTLTLEVTDGSATATDTTLVQVTAAGATAVPVLPGWWLLPGLLFGVWIIWQRRNAVA